jgi:hypothetical protein
LEILSYIRRIDLIFRPIRNYRLQLLYQLIHCRLAQASCCLLRNVYCWLVIAECLKLLIEPCTTSFACVRIFQVFPYVHTIDIFQMLFYNYYHSYTQTNCVIQCKLLTDYATNYFYNESVCTVPPVSIFNQTIVSTSLAVCQRLCSDTSFYDLKCSGLFWFRLNQSCTLTSYTGNGEINNCSATNALDHVMYFRRIRYVHTRPIYCTFDDDIDTGACPLIESDNYIHKWERPTAKSINIYSKLDVTTYLDGGKVLWLNTTGAFK